MTSNAAINKYAVEPLRMVDETSRLVGSYEDIVVALRAKVREVRELRKVSVQGQMPLTQLEVVVFGHGGRDTNCWLALVEAVASDKDLQEIVHVTVCSCSWPDDSWEPVMADFTDFLMESGKMRKGSMTFNVLKYGEEPERLMARVNEQLAGKHLIIQCEQGVDMFIEPVTSEWLQDNFEDWFMHCACMKYAETEGIQSLLIQTNADLDLGRGIDQHDLEAFLFGDDQLQTSAFNQQISFKSAEASEPSTLLDLAVKLGGARDKKHAFIEYLGFNPANHSSLSSFYAGYMAFSASQTDAAIPVAGILEVISCLLKTSAGTLPWSLASEADSPPQPMWMLARFLTPNEDKTGCLRVLTQCRAAGIDQAKTYAEFLVNWMKAREARRRRRHCVPSESRFKSKFWSQLQLAKLTANSVRTTRPDFILWDGEGTMLTEALQHLAQKTKEHTDKKVARADAGGAHGFQPDYGSLSPLAWWVMAHVVHILDFTCRMLESPRGVDGEYEYIKDGLPTCEGTPEPIQEVLAELLLAALVEAWTGSNRNKKLCRIM